MSLNTITLEKNISFGENLTHLIGHIGDHDWRTKLLGLVNNLQYRNIF